MTFQLAHFDIDAFLRESWQRKPALIKNPWAQWRNPLPAEELAGLALDEEVESRLIESVGGEWAVENGPLPEARFGDLGGNPWTLLVQAVDHIVPDVAALIEPFRFIPSWRIDDVMVSYANDGGGVGAHYDNYDVFLIQGAGRRRWQVGQHCNEDSALIPHEDLRLLAEFEATDEWILEPGDILYVPPGIAHNGIAVGDDCMTYSIGFRAPSLADLVDGFSEHMLDRLSENERYTDADLARQDNPGEISADAIDRLHSMVMQQISDREDFARWFGAYNSAPKYPEIDWAPEEKLTADDIKQAIASSTKIIRNPASRFAFTAGPEASIMLFVDGAMKETDGVSDHWIRSLCAHSELTMNADILDGAATEKLIMELYNTGSITLE